MTEYMKAGRFKSQCLRVMDRVKKTRRKIIITKRNIPIAQLTPLEEGEIASFGKLKGTVLFMGDITNPIDEEWDVNR